MGNPCVSHSITEAQIDDNYELLCRLWSPLVGAEEGGGLSTPIARSTQRVNKNTKNKCMRGVRVFLCYARMYSGNSVPLNKTKIRWKGIFLEVCVVFNLSQISLL